MNTPVITGDGWLGHEATASLQEILAGSVARTPRIRVGYRVITGFRPSGRRAGVEKSITGDVALGVKTLNSYGSRYYE